MMFSRQKRDKTKAIEGFFFKIRFGFAGDAVHFLHRFADGNDDEATDFELFG